MRYLLDVNTLIALGQVAHAHHQRAQIWQSGLAAGVDVLGTCAITELGFVRVSVQSGLQTDIFTARAALERLQATGPVAYELWPDTLGADRLPAYVRKPAELTDGHLLELARAPTFRPIARSGTRKPLSSGCRCLRAESDPGSAPAFPSGQTQCEQAGQSGVGGGFRNRRRGEIVERGVAGSGCVGVKYNQTQGNRIA